MILTDANVLICAFGTDTAEHAICKPWLGRLTLGDAQFGVSLLVLSAVARITTNPRISNIPVKSAKPCPTVTTFCTNRTAKSWSPDWTIFSRLCIATGTRGPRITDAWFAALAIERGCNWITFDRDYARFPGLDWRDPVI